jgi:uncharacterized SAM-binding protein YcdF (DUF218 family)
MENKSLTAQTQDSNQRPGNNARICLLVVVVGLVVLYFALRGAGAFLITGDRLKKSDVVVALGGGEEYRVEESVRLINEGYGLWLLLTEPGEVKPGQGMASGFFRSVAIENGLSPHAILVTDGVQRNTNDEAHAVLKLMEKHHFQSVIVVTDPYHTMRTRMVFRSVFQDSGRTVRVHPVPDHWYRSGTWFFYPMGWEQTIREYLKVAGFYLRIYPEPE